MTLTTDFGTSDWYVAAVKGVVLSRVPDAHIVDVSHEVPPGDVATAGFLLSAAAPAFPAESVHLAVVDPGVGTDRRILVVESDLEGDDGWRRHLMVAPDNGLLEPFLDGAERVVSVERRGLFRSAPGHTFHGRDRFAPVAAALLRGVASGDMGQPVDDPVRLALAPPRRTPGALYGAVRHVDRFGNLVTDLPAGWLDDRAHPTGAFEAEIEGHTTDLRVNTYQQIHPGRAAVLTGSLGTLELSLGGADLADAWGVRRGAQVTIRLRSGSTLRTSEAGSQPVDGEQHDPVGVPHHQHSE